MSKPQFLATVDAAGPISQPEKWAAQRVVNAPASPSSTASTRLQPPLHERQQQQDCALYAVRSIIRALSPNLKVSLPEPVDMNRAQVEHTCVEADFVGVPLAKYIPDPSGKWSENAIRRVLLDNKLTMDRQNLDNLIKYPSGSGSPWSSPVPVDVDSWIINKGGHWY